MLDVLNAWMWGLIFCTGFCLAGLICLEHSVQILHSLKLTANALENRPGFPKGNDIVFQPSIFRGEMLVSRSVYHLESRWRSPLPLVLVYHGPLLFATFWEWLAIYFYYGVCPGQRKKIQRKSIEKGFKSVSVGFLWIFGAPPGDYVIVFWFRRKYPLM